MAKPQKDRRGIVEIEALMRGHWSRFGFATLCAGSLAAGIGALAAGEPVAETLSLARRALHSDGVSMAWKLAQRALADAPDSAVAHEVAGEVLFRKGEFQQSEAEFKNATKLDPNLARAWWGLARIAACTSMDKTADQYFARAHDLDPHDSRLYVDWALRLRGAEHIDALETFLSMPDPAVSPEELIAVRQHLMMDKALHGRKINTLTSAYKKTDIPLLPFVTTQHRRTFGLEVELNGHKLRLVLDTGAGGLVIQRSSAEKAGVSRLASATLHGFGDNAGLRGGYIGLGDRLRVGDVEYQNPVIQVSDQEFSDIQDGLIGANMFSEFRVTIDFVDGKLRLEPLEGYRPGTEESIDATRPPDINGWARVYQFGHMLLLPTRVGDTREALFVIDTGAARTLISYDLAAELSKLSRDEKTGLRGINGKVTDVYDAGNLYLQFAGFRQKNLDMTSFDMWPQSRGMGVEVSGFLGLPVLSLFRLTIDYRDGLVKFDYPGR